MKLIIGLGNPGREYQKTRHNAGFMALDLLLAKYGFTKEKNEFNATVYLSTINNEKVLFVKPLTYMNNSGASIRQIMDYYKINKKDVIVIHDEKDFPIGKNQFKTSGSAAGHNGIKSMIQHLSGEDFNRWRLGIGLPENSRMMADWVLSNFTKEERELLDQSIYNSLSFLQDWINGDTFQNIMNKYN
ncbi:aminoacyl-tRNA hydrolase [Williamsoniiplasma lucivorax]|uniref:Peptidyl-tRNA hydrolase n=1 Tax=Williamsoniiplasma lucivorax TaxID=209274 RepID=A0A2S5RFA9_9MOLU|nr:aminoacyl-tRNA hydrolase [Williamsoniiplasma lucivorax]PPE05978.1 peptidyl-tRNA hydrolase [Williamsoniiplasma lucivorax]